MRTLLSKLEGNYKINEFKHTDLKYVKNVIPNFENLRKFTIIRNPWDRLHSFYYYIKQQFLNLKETDTRNKEIQCWYQDSYNETTQMSFNEWILNTKFYHYLEKKFQCIPITVNKKSQLDYISEDNKLLIPKEHIFKYEELDTVFEFLKIKNSLEHKNRTVRPDYRSEYSNKSKKHIQIYFREIKEFEYKF